MAQKLTANMPEGLVIGDGYILRWRAVDPTTGADVAGVVVSNVNVAVDAAGSVIPGDVGNPILIGVNL